jgi:hypothetical protein
VGQILDPSLISRNSRADYSTGVRLAWTQRQAELCRPGANGREVQLVSVETDGSDASLIRALEGIRGDASICALLGCAGDRLAVRTAALARQLGLKMANVGPWMEDSRHDTDDQLFSLSASREQQMRHLLKNLGGMGTADC